MTRSKGCSALLPSVPTSSIASVSTRFKKFTKWRHKAVIRTHVQEVQ
jgi:hypothetical protein